MTGPGVSPYSWSDTLSWLVHYLKPSIRRRSAGVPRPSAHRVASPASRPVRLLFIGDLMCMRWDRVPTVDSRLTRLVASADLVIGNCEAPVTRQKSREDASFYFTFDMAEEYLETFLQRLGVEPEKCVLSVANNHIGDQGENGLVDTVDRLRRLGVLPLGSRADGEPTVAVRVGGINVLLAAWTHWMNRDVFKPSSGVWRAEDIAAIPRRAWTERKARFGTDCLIGVPHWDYEFNHFPREQTREFARRMTSVGFDLLVGHHPHVCQPIEWLDGGICLYSVGNLNGPTSLLRSWPSKLLGVFEVQLISTGRLRGRIASYKLHPFVQQGRSRDVALIPLDRTPRRLRTRLERRLRLIYPTQQTTTQLTK